MTLAPATRIGPYEVISAIGVGGMGEVYKAQDIRLDRVVALKVLASHFAGPEASERFERETRTAASLNHPNICTVYDAGITDSGIPYLSMELLTGETLQDRLSRGPLSIDETLKIGSGLADALDTAHKQGIIHRDIKPANVFLTARGPKLLDFGIAKATAATQDDLTQSATPALTSPGSAVGTVAYMSPEQLRGLPLDTRTDLFSLGLVMYEMATGRPAFSGNTTAVISASILHEEPESPKLRRPDLPDALDTVVMKALEKDRELRFQTARELRVDLERVHRARESHRIADVQPRKGVASSAVTGWWQPRRLWIAAAIAAIGVAAVAAIAWSWATSRDHGEAFDMSALRIDRITQNGQARLVALSPDGRYIAYVQRTGAEESLWVRQVTTRSDILLLPPDTVVYVGVSFSPDGNYVYFTRSDRTSFAYRTLYSVATLGGNARKLIEDVDTAVAFSPDRKRLAFIRGDPTKGIVRLMIANLDGTDERALVEVPAEVVRHNAPDWSPDGRTIAVATTDRTSNSGTLAVVDVSTGTARSLYRHTGRMGRGRWRPDGRGLIVPLDEWMDERAQLWSISYPGGEARRFTNDLSDYSLTELDVTADGRTLATVEDAANFDVEVIAWPDGAPKQVTTGGKVRTMAWGPDGSLYYVVAPHVFRTDALGTHHQQLTPEGTVNASLAVCGDGTILVGRLESDRTSIWRMDSDGSNAARVVANVRLVGLACSPDGKWFAYGRSTEGRIVAMRAAMDGSGQHELFDGLVSTQPLTISPDGSRIAAAHWEKPSDPSSKIRLGPADGKEPVSMFRVPASARGLGWSRDGNRVEYALTRDGLTNVWEQELKDGRPRQITKFNDKTFVQFAWSHDGKRLALLRGGVRTDVVVLSNFVADANRH